MTDDPPPDRAAVEGVLAAVARRVALADRLTPTTGDDILSAVARTAALVLDAEAASVALHDPMTGRLVFRAAAGPQGASVIGLAIEATAGIAGYAFSTGQPLAIADVGADPRFDRSVAEATGYVPRSLLATPLTDARGTLGVLEVLDRRAGTFTMHDLEIAGALAAEAASVVRAGTMARDTTRLLAEALAALAGGVATPGAPDAAAIDALASAATAELADGPEDGVWLLADRLAKLGDAEPESLALAIDVLDAFIRHRAGASGRRR